MRTQASSMIESPRLDEFSDFREFESPQTSYFYVDAYQIMPDGSYRFLQKTKPWIATEAEAGRIATGMCVKWANNNPTWKVGVRCYRWTGRAWTKCGFWNITPCQDIG